MREIGNYAQTSLAFVKGSSTSLRAAEAAEESGFYLTQRELLLNAYQAAGSMGLTDDEAMAATGINPNSFRLRRRELMAPRCLPPKVVLARNADGTPRERLSRCRRLACVYVLASAVR